MAPSRASLTRNIRPIDVREDKEIGSLDGDSADGDELSQVSEDLSAGSDDGEADGGASEEESDAEVQLGSVSFGALKQAQDSLARKRKRGSDETDEQAEKLEVLRARLRELREKQGVPAKASESQIRGKASDVGGDKLDDNSDSDSAPSEVDAPTARSKHAPMAQSSKHQVTRKRQVIDLPNRRLRDPRFDALNAHAQHPGDNTEKAYSFLRDYQTSEIADLKAALKMTADPDAKDKLKTIIGAMENRIRSKAAKEREQEVIRQHRREEKSKVEQGKTPYYLKRAELKERVQVK
ncbi:rRNA biogenesis protein rrp36, partial [Oleoguttula sp. CCFEE 5521]